MRKCTNDCTCRRHRVHVQRRRQLVEVSQLSTFECYLIAAPLDNNDFRVLSRTFGFGNGEDFRDFVIGQQLKADFR